jgi:hypothetical protein
MVTISVAGRRGGGITEGLTMTVPDVFLSRIAGATVTALGKTTELRFNTVSKITKSTTPQSAATVTIRPVRMDCRIKDLPD